MFIMCIKINKLPFEIVLYNDKILPYLILQYKYQENVINIYINNKNNDIF